MSASQRTEPEQSPSCREPSAATNGDGVLLEWTVHLLQRDPRRAWGIAATAFLAASGGVIFFQSAVFAAAGGLLILSSAAEFLLPIRYRLTSRGAACSYGLTRYEISWRDVRRLIPTADGVKLSPLFLASRLDAFRGVLLRFAEDGSPHDRARITELVGAQIAAEGKRVATAASQVGQSV
jgi:hypothetical protein